MRTTIFILFLLACNISSASFEDAINATCSVRDATSIGSGVVVSEDDDKYFILTAGHVVIDENDKVGQIWVSFFHSGWESHAIPAKFEKGTLDQTIKTPYDLALVSIRKSDLDFYPAPTVIPLAEEGTKIPIGSVVSSCGCPNGGWPTLWRGRVLWNRCKNGTAFLPKPKSGRSGSALFNKDATRVIGIIIWEREDFDDGLAVPLDVIYEVTGWGKEKPKEKPKKESISIESVIYL